MTPFANLTGLPVVDLVALAAILLIGLPHGALDGAIAIHLGYGRNVLFLLRFLGAYIGASILVVIAWVMLPEICLILFLLISMIHFGIGDARTGSGWQKLVEAVAHGGLVVAGISQLHRAETDVIFGYLVGGDTQSVWMALDGASVVVALALLFCVVMGVRDRRWRLGLAELILLAALFALLPPLAGFALYFCLVHSARHVAGIYTSLRGGMTRLGIINQAVIFSLLSWAAGAVAYWYLVEFGEPEPTLLRVVFIGLAALTVPHMILVDGVFRRARRTLRRQFMSR